MALNATQIVDGINAAGFTQAEWNMAQLVNKLQVSLGLKRAEISNLQTWLGVKNTEYEGTLDMLRQEESAIEAAINDLAPPVE